MGVKPVHFESNTVLRKLFGHMSVFLIPNDLAIVAKTDSQHEDTLLKVMVTIRIKTLL